MKTKDMMPDVAVAKEVKAITEIALGIDRKQEQLMGDHQRLVHHLRRFAMYAGTGPEPAFPVTEVHYLADDTDANPEAARRVPPARGSTEEVEDYLLGELHPFHDDQTLRFKDATGKFWIADIKVTWEEDPVQT